LLDFWATWCGPCRAELPAVRKVYEDLHAKGFEILGVSLDNADTSEKLADFTASNKITWPQISDGQGWQAELATKYGVRSIPAAFLIDAKGKIAAMGADLRGERLRPTVEAALGGKPLPSVTAASKRAKAPPAEPDPLLAKAEAAQKKGALLKDTAFLGLRKTPSGTGVELPAANTKALSGREVARIAREAYMGVGWFYHCTRCDHWHLKLAGAYPIAKDAVATAWHVTNPPDTLKEGYLVAVDNADNFHTITEVITGSAEADAIVLRIKDPTLKPLPLNDSPEVGDTAYCFSNPLTQKNYFSSGIVNRLHLVNDNGAKPTVGAKPSLLRLNVSTDWAPGSSGAAVLDSCGNVIGHVATINPLFESNPSAPTASNAQHKEDRFHNASLMTLHDAIPAAAVLSLLRK
jgi:peroxiredoxin